MRFHTSIRTRLTLWYGLVLAAIIVAFSASVYLLMRHHLMALTDAGLSEELTKLADDVVRAKSPDGLGPRYAQHEGYELQVATPDGRALFRGERLGSQGLPVVVDLVAGKTNYATVSLERLGRVRMASRLMSGTLLLQAATSLDSFHEASHELLTVMLLMGPAAAAASLGVGYILTRKAMAPVDRMVAEAAEITATSLDRRLDVPAAGDELARLAETLNVMIERLERSFERMSRFTADAAHELRTPLTVIRTSAEVALRLPRSPEQDRRAFENLLIETDRLGRIVVQLLDLRRLDHGLATSTHCTIRLDELTREVVDLMQIAAEEKGLHIDVASLAPCLIRGDADRLRQLLINLLDNAIKYTPPGGRISIRGVRPNGQTSIEVVDTGVGIPADHLPRIFDRFYRVDASRCRDTEGTGLGLSICRAIAEAHQGELRIESKAGQGTTVILTLPRGDASSQVASVGRASRSE